MDTVLTHIWRKLYCLILPEENYENPSAIHVHCAQSHLKQCYTPNSTWGKSRESWVYTWTPCSFTFEAKLYRVILPEENHENPSAVHVHCVQWHLKQCCIPNSTWGKSRETWGYTWTLCSLTIEAKLYCLILPEENHEKPRAIHGHCAHSQLKQSYIPNSTWGISRET
jgi:hypothetical protein